MVRYDRTRCEGCPHYVIVRTINRPEGELSCRFAIIPCDTCRQMADDHQDRIDRDRNNKKSERL